MIENDGGAPGWMPGDPVRIRASLSLCHGFGNCKRWAPNVYFLSDDGHEIGFQFLEVPSELGDDAWAGAEACPQGAIQVLGPPRPLRRYEIEAMAKAAAEKERREKEKEDGCADQQ